MYILPFIIIILCQYSSSAANETPISLDINTRENTDQVKVTIKKDGNMITYRIEPQRGYKIGKFVDGNKIILEPEDNVNYKYVEVKTNEATDYEPILLSLGHSQGTCTKGEVTYFLVDNECKKVTEGVVRYITKILREGEKVVREVEFEAYNAYIEIIRFKIYSEVDISKKDDINGVTRKDGKEGNIETLIYKVNDDNIIVKVKSGSNVIWKWEDYVCGCYELKVYPKVNPILVVLTVKYIKDTKLLYYKRKGKNKYSKIEKDEFDGKFKELRDNKNNTNNN